jgi:hypothetical protein
MPALRRTFIMSLIQVGKPAGRNTAPAWWFKSVRRVARSCKTEGVRPQDTEMSMTAYNLHSVQRTSIPP